MSNWKEKFKEIPFAHTLLEGDYLNEIIIPFVETEIIEKLIEEIPDDLTVQITDFGNGTGMSETRNAYYTLLKQQLRAKWLEEKS